MNELFFLATLKIFSVLLTFNGLLIIYLDIDCFVFFLTSACETYQIYRLYILAIVTVLHIAPLGLFFFHGKAFYFKYSSVYVSIPNFQSINPPQPSFLPGNDKFIL